MTNQAVVPEKILSKYTAWQRLWKIAANTHYVFGILGVAAAALSAAVGGVPGQLLAAAAAVCTAVLGFTQPERKYLKFVRAWRVLDDAIMKYEGNLINLAALIAAAAEGEKLITEFESSITKPETK